MPAAAVIRLLAGALALTAALAPSQAQSTTLHDMHQDFLNPPDDAKPMMRWWWFGPAVSADEIRKEIDQMHSAGIGGFELASVYPLSLDDSAKGIHNLRYASPGMMDMLRVAQQHARELGMRVDLTLGSGWPFGGPHIPLELAAGKLKLVALEHTAEFVAPTLQPGETIVAVFSAHGTPEDWDAASAQRCQYHQSDDPGVLVFAKGQEKAPVLLFFIASHTRQQVKRASVGAEGYVLDHMSRAAIDTHNREVSEKLLQSFADTPPYAVFSDSLEAYGSDWTPHLPEEFKRRRGYDLLPHLPELWQGGTPQAEAVRHDWGVMLSELVRENYLQPMADFAAAHGTRFRSQTYGEPAVTLRDELTPQLAEGEGPQWNEFSFTRWAASANHIAGRNITSAETWTWLHSPAFRATPLDMKVEADRMFLQGVNQIVGHGWPYSPAGAQEPGYSLYAAAVFNAHNPWWPVMPPVMRYLQRVSWLLRQGEPANDVAILLPEDDAQAAFSPGHVSVTDEMKKRITPALMQAVLASGHNVDYIDAPTLERFFLPYKVIVVPPAERMPLKAATALDTYAKRGGKIIVIDKLPHLTPGLRDAAETPRLQSVISRLGTVAHQTTPAQLTHAINTLASPAFSLDETNGTVGFIQRHLADRDVYFIANTSPEPQTFTLHVTSVHKTLSWWDIEAPWNPEANDGDRVTLPPYGSRVLTADDERDTANFIPEPRGSVMGRESLTHWTAAFPGSASSPTLPPQADAALNWASGTITKFYSGEVHYTTHFTSHAPKRGGTELRFAEGNSLPDTQPANKPGIRAWYDAPIREAATVFVNGKEAGCLWHPPYMLDITGLVQAGDNTLEVRVYNTAINALAGQAPRDYTALKAAYGDRFQMQDVDHLEPVASGIFGPVEIVTLAPRSRFGSGAVR